MPDATLPSTLPSTPTSTLTFVLVSVLAFGATGAPATAGELSAFESCALGPIPARCATLEVAENPAEPLGRRISLRIAVLPATGSGEPRPDPLLVLEGGPGASVLATAPIHASTFPGLRRERDLVFVEQRGTGGPSALDCELGALRFDAEEIARCRERLVARADPRFYGTRHAVRDLIAANDALGYQRVNVFGVSYGTRTALELVRRHPERVRSVALLGTYPPERNAVLDAPVILDRSLQLLTAECAADEACSEAFPVLRKSIDAIEARLDAGELDVSRLELGSTLRLQLFYPLTAAQVPLVLQALARGDSSALRSSSGTVSSAFGGITDGAFLSLLCSEDVARLDPEQLARTGAGTLLRDSWGKALLEACAAWPRAEVPEDFHAALDTDTPILSLTGELDPSMPPSWGEQLAGSLPNARHLTIPHAQHGLLGMRGILCVVDLLETFVREGSADGLDASCLDQVQRPPFALR